MAKKNKIIAISLSVLTVTALLVIGCAVYLGDYYRADTAAVEAFVTDRGVEPIRTDSGDIAFIPDEAVAGFIFYPGGKVEHLAYAPLMSELATHGILCVIVEMPFNLAVLDSDAADGIIDAYPEIDSWYIGGHSLGGSMAAAYVADRADDYDGLVLLGSYSTADLSESGLRVLSIYGSEDRVMNCEKYEKYKGNLPSSFIEQVIDGGSHAYFGMYGLQDGDGSAAISNEEQICVTADTIAKMLSTADIER